MHTFRRAWLALMGAILIVTLSVSAAFGAKPIDTAEGPRGQSVAAFVHDLVFGSDETDEDEVVEEDESSEDEEEDSDDEESEEEDTDEESEEVEEDSEEVEETGETASGQEHGECVSEEASDKTDEVDEEGNHGSVVSVAARETCWEPEESDEETAPEEEQEEEEDSEREVPDGFANHGKCVSAAAHNSDGFGDSDADNFGAWMTMHARFVCWSIPVPGDETDEDVEDSSADEDDEEDEASAKEQRKAERAAAMAERHAARAAKFAARGGGHGNGHGGGRR